MGPSPALWRFILPAPAPGLSQPRFILIRNRKAGSSALHINFESCDEGLKDRQKGRARPVDTLRWAVVRMIKVSYEEGLHRTGQEGT